MCKIGITDEPWQQNCTCLFVVLFQKQNKWIFYLFPILGVLRWEGCTILWRLLTIKNIWNEIIHFIETFSVLCLLVEKKSSFQDLTIFTVPNENVLEKNRYYVQSMEESFAATCCCLEWNVYLSTGNCLFKNCYQYSLEKIKIGRFLLNC